MSDADTGHLFDGLDRDAPPHVPVSVRIAAGHRALRRRRTIASSIAVAAVVLGGTTTMSILDYRSSPDAAPTVSTPAESDPSTIPVASHEQAAEHRGEGVFFDEQSGDLRREPGTVIDRMVDYPIVTDAERSFALEIDYRGETRWVYLSWSPGDSGSGFIPAREDITFDAWLVDLDPEDLPNRQSSQVAQ